MGALLAKPPLVEAVIEVRYPRNAPHDLLVATLWAALREQYPIVSQAAVVPLAGPGPAYLYSIESADRSRRVRLGLDVLSVAFVGSYPGWEPFVSEFLRILALASPTRQGSIARIGMRYINRVDVGHLEAEGEIDLNRYIRVGFDVPAVRSSTVMEFGLLLRCDEPRIPASLRYQLRVGGPSLLLDLDVYHENLAGGLSDAAALRAWLDAAHEFLERSFFDSLSDEYRKEIS
jgi:uncharacterized protein (TIGR04255 family)